ncbi:hypothetical protein C0993_005760, partial [Termitomyces sp. T159_Od127]
SDNRLSWTNRGKCVDLTAGNTASGTQVIMLQSMRSFNDLAYPQIKSYTCTDNNNNQIWNTGFNVKNLPVTSQNGQFASPGSTVGGTEEDQVAWCTKSGRGTRTIPNGALKGVHFVKTPDYVQVTGVGDFTQLNIRQGDEGGELDNRGADGL